MVRSILFPVLSADTTSPTGELSAKVKKYRDEPAVAFAARLNSHWSGAVPAYILAYISKGRSVLALCYHAFRSSSEGPPSDLCVLIAFF